MTEIVSSFDLIDPEDAMPVQWACRTDYAIRLAAWSSGSLTLHEKTAEKWWPLTAKAARA
jgi:hypothetical protein